MKRDQLAEFIENVRLAPTDEFHEDVVRFMLEEVAKECPMDWLVKLGELLIELRKQEIKDEANRN